METREPHFTDDWMPRARMMHDALERAMGRECDHNSPIIAGWNGGSTTISVVAYGRVAITRMNLSGMLYMTSAIGDIGAAVALFNEIEEHEAQLRRANDERRAEEQRRAEEEAFVATPDYGFADRIIAPQPRRRLNFDPRVRDNQPTVARVETNRTDYEWRRFTPADYVTVTYQTRPDDIGGVAAAPGADVTHAADDE